MSITINIPSALRPYVKGQSTIEAYGQTVGQALEFAQQQHPDLAKHLRDDTGQLRGFVNVFIGQEDIRHLDGEQSPLSSGDALTIVPAIAGGLS